MNGDASRCNREDMPGSQYFHRHAQYSLVALALAAAACAPAKAPGRTETTRSIADRCLDSDYDACVQSCDLGDIESCNAAGRMHEIGVRARRSDIAAAAFYRKACYVGDAEGCFNAGYLIEYGVGGRQDCGCGLVLYEHACTLGHGRGCAYASNIYRQGHGVAKSEARADAFLALACQRGLDSACATVQQRMGAVPTPSAALTAPPAVSR